MLAVSVELTRPLGTTRAYLLTLAIVGLSPSYSAMPESYHIGCPLSMTLAFVGLLSCLTPNLAVCRKPLILVPYYAYCLGSCYGSCLCLTPNLAVSR